VVAARQSRRHPQRVVILRLGLLEQTRRPERIAVKSHRIRRFGIRLVELLGFVAREDEFGHAQRRGDDAHARPAEGVRGRDIQGITVRHERIEILPLGEQQIAKLELDFDRLRGRRDIGANGERGCRDNDRRGADSKGAVHDPSRNVVHRAWFNPRSGQPLQESGRQK